jgi:hypothetical protein
MQNAECKTQNIGRLLLYTWAVLLFQALQMCSKPKYETLNVERLLLYIQAVLLFKAL